MIVRQVNAGWNIVFHSSHGLLAQRIASYLRAGRDLPFWFETQVAIGQHDDVHRVFRAGQQEHLTQSGAPCDFTLVSMHDDSRVSEMQDRIDEAYRKHTWMGIMQSKHAECLYAGEDLEPEMVDMLAREATRRNRMLRWLKVDPKQVQATYDWMQFCDRLSLILCGDDVPAMHRHLEIITDSSNQRFEIGREADERLHIAPWPFLRKTVELSLEYRTVGQLSFSDDAELAQSFQTCTPEIRTFSLHK